VYFLKKANSLYRNFASKEDRQLTLSFKQITGKSPINLSLYRMAMSHSSVARKNAGGIKDSYERLEYLGDAILGMIVAEMLFKKYPFKEEGFLTELRSRIVSRESLNSLSHKIGLGPLVQFNHQRGPKHKSVYGDVLESLVGAFYLDHGFAATETFVIKKLIQPHYDFESLLATAYNHKSMIIEWGQKENRDVEFDLIDEKGDNSNQFVVQVKVDGEAMGEGFGHNKKKAEQDAARKTLIQLNLLDQ
jgi:ribonuclease-3